MAARMSALSEQQKQALRAALITESQEEDSWLGGNVEAWEALVSLVERGLAVMSRDDISTKIDLNDLGRLAARWLL